ncbi:1-acyl-sn-glycerol-3-phosphate acyltransferase [Mariniphaga anaerophila]|uniref:1-acyl-sn-glycerol-3-phosphate acyltransferase n=1 Tax=Mariniphaga anaerophila TaxID=1484053 RepID=A0A1M5DZK8_9BACT|nr:1-acyl-sn-glycerol-3-phosphate acyltransferase [Mariniphaga anaerophila]SHF72314.1 1-acyl-sn-glycerol-3-phosphate acyltransferase [Mariniphaga anaerophila]
MSYEKWSWGYWTLKQYIKFADWATHKKTIITGEEKIPDNKPIVFAPNHQNALSDPMAILLNTHFQPVWLARADIFGKSKTIDAILKFLKIMPVYRLRDGMENLEKNEQTFANSIKVLEHNSALALFPEAAHSAKRQMLVHKKAVPRIVFMAEEKTNNQLDIQIIPTGIYYSHYWKFNGTVIVNFGEPISVKQFLATHKQNQNAATIALKNEIYDAISPLTINIKSKKYYEEFERIRAVYGRHFLKRDNIKLSALNLFNSDQKLVNGLDKLEAAHPEEAEKAVNKAKQYAKLLRNYRLKSWLLDENQKHIIKFLLSSIILLIGFPLFLYGFIFNAIPFFLIDRVTRKKIKDQSFWSTFFLVAGIVLFPIFYLLELLAVSWLIPGFWLKAGFLASLPFTGKIAFNWYILLRKNIGRCRLLVLKWFKKKTYNQIKTSQKELFDLLDKHISN